METKTRNSHPINHRPIQKFNEEKSDSLWSLFGVRLPVLCHKLLTDNHQSKDPHFTSQGRSKENDLDSRSEKTRLIKVKSAKCQVDPREVDTALEKMSRPKRRRKTKQMENLPSEYKDCSDQKTSDRRLPELDFNEKGAGIKPPSTTIQCRTANSLKVDGRQVNVGFTDLETKKIRTANKEEGVETEVCDVDKAGANGSTGAQFRVQALRERKKDTRDSSTETTSQKKQSKAEFPHKQNRTVDTNQTREIERNKRQANGTVHMNKISETQCLKEQTISTINRNQITVSEPELSKEQKNTVQINKILETQKRDYIPNDKQPKCRTERKRAEIQDTQPTNNIILYENEPTKPMKTCLKFGNRDPLISEPNRHNKSETVIMITDELDTTTDYINVTTETCWNNASQRENREAQDTTITDDSVSETDMNNLSETACKEELDNAANEKIIKAGCKEEQDNIANDEKNTSETMHTEQHNNIAPYKNNIISETHKNNASETYMDKVTKRHNTSETELSEKLDNTSKNCKITSRHSGETACLAECDLNNLSVKPRLDAMKETTETLKQNVKIKEQCRPTEQMTSQMSKLDDRSKRELAKSNIHKIGGNEDTVIACNATRMHRGQNDDKNQQKQCRTTEENNKLETESRVQKEHEPSESECKLEHEPSQHEYTKEPELNTGQTDFRKELTIRQPDDKKEKHDKSQPEYRKVPELKTEQIEYRKEHDKSQPECRKENHDTTQREGRKEQELDSQQITSSKTYYVCQPECKKEHKTSESECNISQPEYRKVPELKVEQIEYRKEHDKSQPECRKEKHDTTQREGRKEQELDSQQITSSKTYYVGQPEYEKEQKTFESECDISQPQYRKVPELKVEQIEYRKEHDKSQPECRKEKHDTTQREGRKEQELDSQQITSSKTYYVGQPEYEKEQKTFESECDISQPEYRKVPELKVEQIEYRKEHDKSQPECRKENNDKTQREGRKEQELDSQQIKSSKTHYVGQPEYKKGHKTSESECITEVENDEDMDNDSKLVIKDNLETDKRQNNTSATRNHHEQNNTAETIDFQEANSGKRESKRADCEAMHDHENTRKTSEWEKCEGATNKANTETNTNILKSDDVSTYFESYQTMVLPKPALNDDRPDLVEVCDNHRAQIPELSHLEGQEVSTKLPARNENMISQTTANSNLPIHFLAFEAEPQATAIDKSSPLCSLSAKTVAVSDSIKNANQIYTPNSSNNLKSCDKNEILVLLSPVCNNFTKNPTQGISGVHSGSSCVIAIPSNSPPPKDSRALTQMISRRVSAYILDSKTNTARIVPLDSSINYTVEQGDRENAVFSEDIHFQNCRLWHQNSEARPRRVSSIDPRYFQSNAIKELRSGSSRRSRSESLTRRCALNKEWEILTKTTREELTIFSPPKQSSKKLKDTVSSKECSPKCSVNNNSIHLQNGQASPVEQVLHETIDLQPLCSSVSVDYKSNRNSNHTELEFPASPVCRELSVDNLTAMEKLICYSKGTKTGDDVSGNSAVQKSTTELFTECTKHLAGSSMLENFETPACLGRYSCSSVDTNTSKKLTTNICRQCGESNMISWCNTNKNPRHSEVLPDICMKASHEVTPFGPTEQDCFETDVLMSDVNCCDPEMVADLNSKQSGSSWTETGCDSTEKELSVANDGCSEIPIEPNYQKSQLTGNKDISFGEKIESFSLAKAQVSSDSFVDAIDPTSFKPKDVVVQCKPYESREVFTQTEANYFTEQSQPVVIQHAAHNTSDTRKTTNFKERNVTSVDNIKFQQSACPKAHQMKYIPTEETKNKIEKLDFIRNNTTNNSTSTDCTDTSQMEIQGFGSLIAKELAGYIFYKEKRKSWMPCRTNIKSEIKRSSSLGDVQADLQNTLVISEKLGTLLDTGQTVLVLKLPPSDCCLMLP